MPEPVSFDPSTPFRGWVRQGDQFAIQQLTLNPIGPMDVVVRNKAAQACYTLAEFLPAAAETFESDVDRDSHSPRGGHQFDDGRAMSPGHGAAGVVVAVGLVSAAVASWAAVIGLGLR